jgi:hypothetical protein
VLSKNPTTNITLGRRSLDYVGGGFRLGYLTPAATLAYVRLAPRSLRGIAASYTLPHLSSFLHLTSPYVRLAPRSLPYLT